MGILDFLSKKSPAAPAPAGATDTTAAPADALKAEIVNHGLDASRINIAVEGSTVTLTGGAATTADAEKIALAVGNTKGVSKVVNNIVADASHQDSGFYTVKSGDTLWKIAEQSYGHGQGPKFQQIFEANRPLLKNANSIFPGQVLRIPGAGAPQASASNDKKGDNIVLEGAHDLDFVIQATPPPSYVDGPLWQALFDILNGLVGFGHMSGLLMRRMAAGPDEVRWAGSRSLRRAYARDGLAGCSWPSVVDRVVHHVFLRLPNS